MSLETAAYVYLRDLVNQYEALESEKAVLQDPAARLTAINTQETALINAATSALATYNAAAGTSWTLTQVRKFFTAERSTG